MGKIAQFAFWMAAYFLVPIGLWILGSRLRDPWKPKPCGKKTQEASLGEISEICGD